MICMFIAVYYFDTVPAFYGGLLFIFTSAVYLSAYQSFAKRAFLTIKQALPVFGKFLIVQILVSIVVGIVLIAIMAPFVYYVMATQMEKSTIEEYIDVFGSVIFIGSTILQGTAAIMPFFAFYFYDSDRNFGSWWNSLMKALKTTFMYYPSCLIVGLVSITLKHLVFRGFIWGVIFTILEGIKLSPNYFVGAQLTVFISMPFSVALFAALYKHITKQR